MLLFHQMKNVVDFYQKENGKIPVKEFIKSLDKKTQIKVFDDIQLLIRHGLDLKEPYVKRLHGDKYRNLYELRIKKGRIMYFMFSRGHFILLNGFLKKDNKTPEKELARAKRYMEDYLRRNQS